MPVDKKDFVAGKMYICVRSDSYLFKTEGVYQCVFGTSYLGDEALMLVGERDERQTVRGLASQFEEMVGIKQDLNDLL